MNLSKILATGVVAALCLASTTSSAATNSAYPGINLGRVNAVQLKWPQQAGLVYQVQTAPNAYSAWSNCGYALFGYPGGAFAYYPLPVTGTPRFRVVRGQPQNALDFSKSRCLALTNNLVVFENVLLSNNHYQVSYRMGQAFKETSKRLLTTWEIAPAAITLDGNPADWTLINPVYMDALHDQSPPNGHAGTDVRMVKISRDSQYIYVAFYLHDANPAADGTVYLAEFQQYFNQYHTPGDTFVSASYSGGWQVTVEHRENLGAPSSEYGAAYVGVGTKFIEFKVPIQDIEYDGLGLFGKAGIETRFLRTYVHYIHNDNPQDPLSTYDGAGETNRVMIVHFY